MVKYSDVILVEELLELLRLAKEKYTYQQLSEILGLPPTVLNRYLKGRVSPRRERCLEIIEKLRKIVDITDIIKNKLRIDNYGFMDMSQILSDIYILKSAARRLISDLKVNDSEVDIVLTAAVDGIPIAVIIAEMLGAKLVYAKNKKEVGVQRFHEVTYVVSSTGIIESLYVPKELIRSGDKVLIVDDFIRTGETQRALHRMTLELKGEPIGIGAIVGVKTGINTLEKELKIPVKAVVYV
ncbi:MAG: adenine phosphoribosyltransferase [Thermoplasmata archaeon]|nr:helix-turn-helix domain-containing protein [Euryarchaeota archaeon]RLF63385.1 MAG: adenine phosphoribosyltransferase [Thermoplasmata archaeon]